MDGVKIPFSDLGVTLDNKINWKMDIDNKIAAACKKYGYAQYQL